MRQTSRYNWDIVSKKGSILQADLSFKDAYQAEQYVKNYITSFQSWDYEMEPLWLSKLT